MLNVDEAPNTSQRAVQDTLSASMTAEEILRDAEENIERLQM